MSFAFGFNDDDISDDEVVTSGNTTSVENAAVDAISSPVDPQHLPKLHSLGSILSQLTNVRISFDNYITPIGGNVTYRRELFDIKHQVMCEDEDHKAGNGLVNDILMGDDHDVDLKKNVYEGGFKSWECSYDVVDALVKDFHSVNEELDLGTASASAILELGCGTALPSCQLLLLKLQAASSNPLNLILSDFNYEVLRLVTIPNLIIHWASTLDPKLLNDLCSQRSEENDMVGSEDVPVLPNDEILLTPKLLEHFQADLNTKNIELNFISGSWGKEFLELVSSIPVDLVISSETIYSLETLPIVAESVLDIISHTPNSCAFIAAKNFYFGVGGSVVEFVNYVNEKKDSGVKVDVEEVNSQLKRSLIRIR